MEEASPFHSRFTIYYLRPLPKYGVAAAARVVAGLAVEALIVVVEDEVLSLVVHDVGDAAEVALVLGDDEGHRAERGDDAGGVNVAAFVIDAAGVLRRADC